jgi:hypothetical protein
MPTANDPISATQIERDILRTLCAVAIDPSRWRGLVNQLSDYEWKDPEHKVVFDALRQIKSDDAHRRRQELPAQVTRMGFPDVNWEKYLDADVLPNVQIQALIDRLSFGENS